MKNVTQRVIQAVFLILFTILTITGRVQLWMGVFAAGVILSLVMGRIYCGWACPIRTVTGGVSFMKRKLSLASFRIPRFFSKTWIRYAALAVFAATFAFVMVTGKKLPVLHALFAIAVGISLFYPEELWHRHLCPYGTILRLFSKKPRYTYRVSEASCLNCGICAQVCPAGAIEPKSGHHSIRAEDCLVYGKCSMQCKPRAIRYRGSNAAIAEIAHEPQSKNRSL